VGRLSGKAREAHEGRREEALADIREKVADGSLTIRQMTAEERERYGVPQRKAA